MAKAKAKGKRQKASGIFNSKPGLVDSPIALVQYSNSF